MTQRVSWRHRTSSDSAILNRTRRACGRPPGKSGTTFLAEAVLTHSRHRGLDLIVFSYSVDEKGTKTSTRRRRTRCRNRSARIDCPMPEVKPSVQRGVYSNLPVADSRAKCLMKFQAISP